MPRKSSRITQENVYLNELILLMFQKRDWSYPNTDDDLIVLVEKINDYLNNHEDQWLHSQQHPCLRATTVKRLLRKEKYDKSFDIAITLNTIAILAEVGSWEAFVRERNEKQNEELKNRFVQEDHTLFPPDIFNDAECLNVGAKFIIGWHPTRYIEIEYLGDCEFKIVKYQGEGKDRTGDTVEGRWFELKYEIGTSKSGEQTNMPVIVGVLGNEIFDPVYL